MATQLVIAFNGVMGDGNRISLRTISHTLPHLQRAIDKLVIYERQGVIGKGATLHQAHYDFADLYLERIEAGSVILPLVGNLLTGVTLRFNAFLSEPYREAENSLNQKLATFDDRVDTTRSQIASGILVPLLHEEMIETQKVANRDYAQSAFLNDINNMISPLRSSLCSQDTITIKNVDPACSSIYVFNQDKSKAFAKVVKEQRLAHPVSYTGRLEGLVNRGTSTFPYAGKFICSTTGKEMKLLVASEQDALALNKYNIGKAKLNIIACPLAVYGAFDPLSGDIVFINFK